MRRKAREMGIVPEVPRSTVGSLSWVDVEAADMITIRNLEDVGSVQVRDAFVKLAPTIMAAERETFDATALKRRLIDSGAREVVVDPVVIQGALADRGAVPVADLKPREAVEAWFSQLIGVDAGTSDRAKEIVLEVMEVEGL
jgi:hypothetical protein